jgi:hypothetical protein
MPQQHPRINALIYRGDLNEKPVPGHFYVTIKDRFLTRIARQAWGEGYDYRWMHINRNVWNRENLVYRKYSTNCSLSSSPMVDPEIAMTTKSPSGAGAYIALCPGDVDDEDKVILSDMLPSKRYQLIYIPRGENLDERIDDRPTMGKTIKTGPLVGPIIFYKETEEKETIPFSPSPLDLGAPKTTPKGEPDYEDDYLEPAHGKKPFPWWILIVIGGAAVGGYAYYKNKK